MFERGKKKKKKKKKNKLEGGLKEWECRNAAIGMELNKSPGSDGLPAIFCISLWDEIKVLLINSLNAAYHIGELSPLKNEEKEES